MRLVLDTNVVLDLLVFRDPGAGPLRQAIEERSVTLLTSPECLAELRRVLGYPEFKLDEAAQAAACDWFVAHAEILETPDPEPLLPRCRDTDDQKFLDLAWIADVEHLVTKDKALLELTRRVAKLGRFTVVQTADLAGRWAGG